jgi:RNase P subunit RPR2
MADMFSAITASVESAGCHLLFLPPPRFEQIHCTNSNHYASGGAMQITLRYPTVTCPGCKQPMTPSPPLAVSDDTDLCDLTYTCKECGATTTRTIKIEKQ